MFLFQQKNKVTHYILVHLDDHVCEIALVERNTGKILFKVDSHRRGVQEYDSHTTLRETIRIFHKSLHQLLKKIKSKSSDTPVKITNALIFLGSPWYEVHLKNLSIEKDTKFKFTEDLVSKIINSEKEAILKLTHSLDKNKEIKIIDTHIAHISLEGYSSQNPFDKEVFSASLSVLFIESYTILTNKLKEILEDHFHQILLNFKSTISSDLYTASLVTSHNSNDVLLNFRLRENSLEITKLDKGALVQIQTLPFGKKDLSKKLAERIQSGTEVADSYIRMYLEGSLNSQNSIIVKDVLRNVGEELADKISVSPGISTEQKEELRNAKVIIAGTDEQKRILEELFSATNLFVHLNKTSSLSKDSNYINSGIEADLTLAQSILVR